jgi:hypothetical protein
MSVCSFCHSKSGVGISLHRFPAAEKHAEVRQEWVNFVGGGFVPAANAFLCSVHFSEDSFIWFGVHGKRKLVVGSKPKYWTQEEKLRDPMNQVAVSQVIVQEVGGYQIQHEEVGGAEEQFILTVGDSVEEIENTPEEIEVAPDIDIHMPPPALPRGVSSILRIRRTSSAVSAGSKSTNDSFESCGSPISGCNSTSTDSQPTNSQNSVKRKILEDDCNYEPSDGATDTSASSAETQVGAEEKKSNEPTFFLVQEEKLQDIFRFCITGSCGKPRNGDLKKRVTGTAVKFQYECLDGHTNIWYSQNKVPNRRYFVGNVLLVLATFLSGSTYTKTAEFFDNFKIAGISAKSFNTIAHFVIKAIGNVYNHHNNEIWLKLTKDGKTKWILAGDAR